MAKRKVKYARVVQSELGVFLRVPAYWDRNPKPGWLVIQMWN
jgi:hypothetical protein